MLLDEDAKTRVAAAIASAEQRCEGEVVVVVAPASSSYFGGVLAWALVGAGLALAGLPAWVVLAERMRHGVWLAQGLALVLVALVTCAALSTRLRMWLVPDSIEEDLARLACDAAFVREGVHRTRAASGVLIYISELERRVYIRADVGITERVPQERWDTLARHLARRIGAGEAAVGLVNAIEQIGHELATHFPPRGDAVNELSDDVRSA